MKPLRPYQLKGLELLRRAYSDGKRKLLFWLATGGGKSVIFLHLVNSLLKNNKRVCLVMRRRQLVFQTQEHFLKSDIACSVMMAGERAYQPLCRLQICSIDTIARRDLEAFGKFDTVIVDECHDAVSETYQSFLKECEALGTELFVGLTATPFPLGKKIHDFWECCIKPIEMHDLRDLGFLVPCDLYVPEEMDYSSIKIDSKTGDFQQGALAEMMSDLKIIGNIVDNYKNLGNGKSGICFGVDIKNSMMICEEFNRAGIPAIHCDQKSRQSERDNAIQMLKTGEIKMLCNVNIFSTGVDIPEAEYGAMARPTRSEVLYIQQVGRLLRPYRRCGKCKSGYDNSEKCYVCGYANPEYIKSRAIIVDHGSNTARHGRPYDVRYAALTKEEVIRNEGLKAAKTLLKTCSNCTFVFEATIKKCPSCGGGESKEKFFETSEGILRPYDEFLHAQNLLKELEFHQNINGFAANWKYFQLYKKMGESCMVFKRELGIPSWVPRLVKEQIEEKQKGVIYQ